MPLEVGSTLGPYEVLSAIGAGGMGEVYKARDTKLDRDVALKILPDAFVNDPERLARFQREAKVLASLNHPNIAQIHGLEESGDSPALVLEYVPGPTLQDRIAKGPIPLDEALPIARQIAEALEAAHEQGIIHRDLKPANVKVKDDGTVKVLDFGLAKALQPELSDLDAANSPTMTMTAAATKMGVIMGTAAYMSPEQAKGRQVDKRADIWAFGVVLFEMLTGRQAFGGTDISETLAAVLKTDLDLDALPADTPRGIRRVISRCMQKDRTQRSRDIGDVKLDLAEALAAPVEETVETAAIAQPAIWQRPVPAVGAALLLVALGGLAVWTLTSPSQPQPRVTRFRIPFEAGALPGVSGPLLALSPDGTTLVYAARNEGGTLQLFRSRMDQLDGEPMADTEGASNPFFSPDGTWVGFRGDGTTIKKVALAGGPVVTIHETSGFRGATWGPDDTIIFGAGVGGGLSRVSADGGEPEAITTPDTDAGEVQHRWPQLLPGGNAVLFSVWSGGQESQVLSVLSLDTGERRLLPPGTTPYATRNGYLVFLRDASLWGVPFDEDRLEVTGGALPIVDGVRVEGGGAVQFALSNDGTLVYVPGQALGASATMSWVDREGREEPLALPPNNYARPRLSPDGARMVVEFDDDIWVSELARGTLSKLTTDEADDDNALWTPDGEGVVFSSTREGQEALFLKAADGRGDVERLLTIDGGNVLYSTSWSPDGNTMVFSYRSQGGFDIALLSMDGDRPWTPLLDSEAQETHGAVSPDGVWLAYASNETGEEEVYVERFPDPGDRRQISIDGGSAPVWSPDGSELFYQRASPGGLMVVPIENEPAFSPGTPAVVVEAGAYPWGSFFRHYDVAPDARRFLVISRAGVSADETNVGTEIVVVLNWFEELRARVPTGR